MEKRYQSLKPLILLVIANILGIGLVIMNNPGGGREAALLCLGMCFLNILVYMLISLCRLGDGYLFIIISMLSSIGIIMQSRISLDDGIRQMKLYLIGVAVFFVTTLIYRFLHKYFSKLAYLYIALSAFLFVATAIFGSVRGGAKNWIMLGGISVQPSEFIRILFVLTLAAVLTGKPTKKKKGKASEKASHLKKEHTEKNRMLAVAAIAYLNAFCLLLQREWGIAVLFFAIYLAFLFIYGKNNVFFFINVLMVIGAVVFGMKFMSHIQLRIDVWRNPFENPLGQGYQILQSLFAISEGGFAGTGIGNGNPSLIPIVESDFIFSAICEEMGTLGGVSVLMLYFVLVYRGFKIALITTNEFNKATSMGLSVMLGIQTFIIVGGVTKLIPLTGITLPFISYGGSSMITTFMVVGILQAISSVKAEITDEIE